VLAYDATLCNSFDGQYEQLFGEMGTVKLAWNAGWLFKEADAPTQGWEVYAIREQFHDEQGITLIADATKLAAQNKLKEGVGLPNPPLWYALSDFLRSVLEGAPVVCTAEEGLRAAAVGILAGQAIETGAEVAIDESALKAE
jgi:predicted dehydrogenase